MVMSSAFDAAFDIVKMNHFSTVYGVALFDELISKAMHDDELRKGVEEYLQMSMGELADLPPEEKAHAFNLLQQHMAQQPKATANPQGEAPMPQEAEPLQKAFRALLDHHFFLNKALPEQQMFVERSPREIAGGAEDFEFFQEGNPEIDRFGARSMGTVHPAIYGMLQRNRENSHQTKGLYPNLNLDLGAVEQRRIARPFSTMRSPLSPEEQAADYRAGMSIAQGPEFNRTMYDGERASEVMQSVVDKERNRVPGDHRRNVPNYLQRTHDDAKFPQSSSGFGYPRHILDYPTPEERELYS